MDIFTWSMPFVSEKVTEMLYEMVRHVDEDDGGEPMPVRDKEIIRNKIKFVSKMAKM